MSSSDELLTYLKAGMWYCSRGSTRGLRYSISKQYLISLPASFAGYLELVNNLKAIEWDLNHNLEGDIQYVAIKLTEFYPSQSPSPSLSQKLSLIPSPRCQNIFRCHHEACVLATKTTREEERWRMFSTLMWKTKVVFLRMKETVRIYTINCTLYTRFYS